MGSLLASILGVIPVSVIASLATTLWLRRVDQKTAKWFVNGYSWPHLIHKLEDGAMILKDGGSDATILRVSNTGNGTAYGVKLRMNPGGNFKTTEIFAGPAIASGEHIEIDFPLVHREDDTAFVEIEWTAPRALRGPHTDIRRVCRSEWYVQHFDNGPMGGKIRDWFPSATMGD